MRVSLGGSSPWARGTQKVKWPDKVKNRFIPVGTGNTPGNLYGEEQAPVHPRGHGEHSLQ